MSVNLSFLLQTYFIFKLKIKNLTLYTKKQTGLILYKKMKFHQHHCIFLF